MKLILTFYLIYGLKVSKNYCMRRRSNQNQDRDLHNKIDNLTRLVEHLQLEWNREREERRSERAERARPRARAATTVPPTRTPVATRVNPVQTLPQVVHATRVETPQQRPGPEFQAGDTIIILNDYRNEQGRTATVTRTHGNKVYFRLDGRPTYRLAHNVERVE